jgi:hypothetical protein
VARAHSCARASCFGFTNTAMEPRR